MSHQIQTALIQTFTEFASYLNRTDLDFHVTAPDIERALVLSPSMSVTELSSDALIPVFRTVFCKTREQYLSMPDVTKRFLRDYQEEKQQYAEQEQEKKRLEEALEKSRQRQLQFQQKLRDLQNAPQDPEGQNSPYTLPQSLLRKAKKELADFDFDSDLLKSLLAGEGIPMDAGNTLDMQDAARKVMATAESRLLNGTCSASQLKCCQSLHKELTKTCEDLCITRETYQSRQEEAQDDLEEKIWRQQRDSLKIQAQIDDLVKDMQKKLTVKGQSFYHREVFVSTGGAVQLLKDSEAPACAEKNFKSLSLEERNLLYRYLREHILKFKTKLTRHIDQMDRASLDMAETIRNACKSGGIPMRLHYQKPRPGKTDLFLVVDISGSCRAASEMLLTFVYLLKDAFPRGCRTFAFVNSLYDLSGMMDVRTQDINGAISSVLGTIPTRGVYSDYGRPIRSLYQQHFPEITRDSIIIWMGDARSNYLDPAYREYRAICRRAKRAYFLNTEKVSSWNTADSIAGGYAKYAKMFEAVNVSELAGFIRDGIR